MSFADSLSQVLTAIEDVFSLPFVDTMLGIFFLCASLGFCCRIIAGLLRVSIRPMTRVHRAELDKDLISPWPCKGFICDAKDCPFVGKTRAYCNSCIRLNDCRFCLHGGDECDRFGKN